MWAEEEGNDDDRRGAGRAPSPGRRPSATRPAPTSNVIHAIARDAGVPQGLPDRPRDRLKRVCRASAAGSRDYAGMSYARLEPTVFFFFCFFLVVFWAVPDRRPTQAARPFGEAFASLTAKERSCRTRTGRPKRNRKPSTRVPHNGGPARTTVGGPDPSRAPSWQETEPAAFVEGTGRLRDANARRRRRARVIARRGSVSSLCARPGIRARDVFRTGSTGARRDELPSPTLGPDVAHAEMKCLFFFAARALRATRAASGRRRLKRSGRDDAV